MQASISTKSDAGGERKLALWLGLGVLAHLAAAWFSLGAHHVDEHFQVLEFLNYKLGRTPAAAMPWEFAARIRPWLQIRLLFEITRLDHALGIRDPIAVERSFRASFALAGLASGLALAGLARSLFTSRRYFRWLVIAECLYWPLVYLHARISSEAFGTTLFVFGLCATLTRARALQRTALGGLLLGLAFMVRFQMAFGVAGLAVYLLSREHWPVKRWCIWVFAFAIAVGLGCACDLWGYGEFVFTPFRYFKVNLVEGRAAAFGVEPIWWYFPGILLWLLPPFSLLVLAGAAHFFAAWPKHPFTWVTLALLLGHMAIGHKELRFLFPLLPFAPVFFLTLVERLSLSAQSFVRSGAEHALRAYAFMAALLLVPMTWRPPKLQTRYLLYVHDAITAPYRPLWLNSEPMQLSDLPVYYYRPRGYAPRQIRSFAELSSASDAHAVLFFWNGVELPPEAGALQGRCRRLFCSVPDFALGLHLDRVIDPEAKESLFACAARAPRVGPETRALPGAPADPR